MEAKRRLGDKAGTDAARWWGKYERLQAPNRHALFGATLTGNELKNYQSFTAKKSDSADLVRGSIEDQIEYSRSLADDRRDLFQRAGYQVPEGKPKDFVQTYSGVKPSGKRESVTVGGQTYDRPANFTDEQWADYKRAVGAKE